jgi:hypothetical protein
LELRTASIRWTRFSLVELRAFFILSNNPTFFSGVSLDDRLKNMQAPFGWND